MKNVIVAIIEPGSKIGMAILLIVLLFVAKSCTDMESARREKEAMNADFIRLIDLEQYVEGTNETIDTKEERIWVENNFSKVTFGLFYDQEDTVTKGVKSYDSSFTYSEEYSLFCSQDGTFEHNHATFFTYQLDGGYTQLEGTVYLTRNAIKDWEWWLENKECMEQHGETVAYEYDDFGLCVIFADNQVIYESPILRPGGTTSDQISLSIGNADEIVICMVGLAYLGAPRVTK